MRSLYELIKLADYHYVEQRTGNEVTTCFVRQDHPVIEMLTVQGFETALGKASAIIFNSYVPNGRWLPLWKA